MPSYLAMIRPLQDQGFRVEYPDLPGCAATVASFREAKSVAGAILLEHLEALQAGGLPVPQPRTMKELQDCGLTEAAVPVLVPSMRPA